MKGHRWLSTGALFVMFFSRVGMGDVKENPAIMAGLFFFLIGLRKNATSYCGSGASIFLKPWPQFDEYALS